MQKELYRYDRYWLSWIHLKFVKSLNTKPWEYPIWTYPANFQTLIKLVKFAMDTKQILANATTIFWMHSFISGHKKVFRNRVSIAHVTVFITRQYPESQTYCSSLMADSWSTASDAWQPRQGETVSFYRSYTERCPVMYINAQQFILCIVLSTQYIITLALS